MKKNIFYTAFAALAAISMTSCDSYLDKMPDNRTEIDTEDKVERMLVSAYPTHEYNLFSEYMSDNLDDTGESNPYTDRYLDQVYSWQDVTETDNSDPESYWQDLNMCIESANVALDAIAKMPQSSDMLAAKAEALLCRAYANFMLVNIFAPHYDKNDATSKGIAWVDHPADVLTVQYKRESVLDNYGHIQADIEAALPLVSDQYYSVPKYHFNKNAAYAFATRFYLYSEQWQKAVDCANVVLGDNPKTMLRDWQTMASMTQDFSAIGQHRIDHTLNCNLLLLTSYSRAGVYFGPYYTGKRYSHTEYIGTNETIAALAKLWNGTYTSYYFQVKRYAGTNLNTWSMWAVPYLFEYTDPVAQIGYAHTVYAAFTADECLLNRAEAYTMLNNYEAACADLSTWAQSVSRTATSQKLQLTTDKVDKFMNGLTYAYDDDNKMASSLKKHLHPKFTIDAEGTSQENLIQLCLAARRYEGLHQGLRWFDIKRYHIVIPRRQCGSDGKTPSIVTDWLEENDLRRAVQIPKKAIDAGYEPNPRNK